MSESLTPSELRTKASESLEEEIQKELAVPDPVDKTIAKLVEETNENTRRDD